jgi:hypothetical protein
LTKNEKKISSISKVYAKNETESDSKKEKVASIQNKNKNDSDSDICMEEDEAIYHSS